MPWLAMCALDPREINPGARFNMGWRGWGEGGAEGVVERERCQVNASNGIMGGLFVGKEAVLFCRAQAPPALPCPALLSPLCSGQLQPC